LTAVDSYYGPVWSYLLAGIFRIFGLSDWAPRLAATVVAALSVSLTFVLGRELVNRWAAFVAAALLLTSGGHIIITSHTARSNSTTPLLLLLVVWTLYRAMSRNDGRYLVAGGFLFALAMQTHISVIAFAPGLGLALLLRRPGLLMSRWGVLAILAALLGYSNMILYNLQNELYSFMHARHLQEGYTGGKGVTLASYGTNAQALVQSLSRLLSGTIDIATSPSRFLYFGAALVGLVLLSVRGQVLPLLFCLSAALVLPYFNPRYGPILSGRYLIPLLPFCFLGIGVVIAWVTDRLPRRGVVRGVLSAVVVTFPLIHLVWYYQEVLADGRTNAALYTLANSARSVAQSEDVVVLDEVLEDEPLTGGGNDLKALRMLLEARGLRPGVVRVAPESLDTLAETQRSAVIIVDIRKRQLLERQTRILETGAVVYSASGSGHRFGVFRIGPRIRADRPVS
jgi:4-amino-4-deoxy-L-arabinose transferase-like glycosyltransferase